jgi:ATP-dependent RNA helicase DDX52/ROK1
LFTEADFENLRTIANVMKQSGCKVEDWMLNLKTKTSRKDKKKNPRRYRIDTTPTLSRMRKMRRTQGKNEIGDDNDPAGISE